MATTGVLAEWFSKMLDLGWSAAAAGESSPEGWSPAVYALVDREGHAFYVGKSADPNGVRKRVDRHKKRTDVVAKGIFHPYEIKEVHLWRKPAWDLSTLESRVYAYCSNQYPGPPRNEKLPSSKSPYQNPGKPQAVIVLDSSNYPLFDDIDFRMACIARSLSVLAQATNEQGTTKRLYRTLQLTASKLENLAETRAAALGV